MKKTKQFKNKESLKIVIGNKNLSSWSMRPWLVLKESGLDFEEINIKLDQHDTQKNLLKYSKSAKVPVLIHGDITVWDSLAISEYIAELVPQKNLWPQDSSQRAIARSYVAEMHSGFSSLRAQLSMDIRLKMQVAHLAPQTLNDIKRILEIWKEALQKSKGPFLFGNFGIVDAFYTPVVFRFLSYGIIIKDPIIKKYMQSIKNHPSVKEWEAAGLKESFQPYEF